MQTDDRPLLFRTLVRFQAAYLAAYPVYVNVTLPISVP